MSRKLAANKWQEGLLDLIGYIDIREWRILWALAANADDDGLVEVDYQELADAMRMPPRKLLTHVNNFDPLNDSTLSKMRKNGLVHIARRRQTAAGVNSKGIWIKVQLCSLVYQIYAGIADGKIPASAAWSAHCRLSKRYLQGRTVNKTRSHFLVRKKYRTGRGYRQRVINNKRTHDYFHLPFTPNMRHRYAGIPEFKEYFREYEEKMEANRLERAAKKEAARKKAAEWAKGAPERAARWEASKFKKLKKK